MQKLNKCDVKCPFCRAGLECQICNGNRKVTITLPYEIFEEYGFKTAMELHEHMDELNKMIAILSKDAGKINDILFDFDILDYAKKEKGMTSYKANRSCPICNKKHDIRYNLITCGNIIKAFFILKAVLRQNKITSTELAEKMSGLIEFNDCEQKIFQTLIDFMVIKRSLWVDDGLYSLGNSYRLVKHF